MIATQVGLCDYPCHLVALSNSHQGCWEDKYVRNTLSLCCSRDSALRTTGQSIPYNNNTFSFQKYHKFKPSWDALSRQEMPSQWVSEAEALGLGEDK